MILCKSNLLPMDRFNQLEKNCVCTEQVQNFVLLFPKHHHNYLHIIYSIVAIARNLEMVKSVQEGMHRLYANTIPFESAHIWVPRGALGTHSHGCQAASDLTSHCFLDLSIGPLTAGSLCKVCPRPGRISLSSSTETV